MFSSSVYKMGFRVRSFNFWQSYHLCVAGIDHDTIKRNPLLSEAERELDVLRICRMIKMHRDRHGCLMSATTDVGHGLLSTQ